MFTLCLVFLLLTMSWLLSLTFRFPCRALLKSRFNKVTVNRYDVIGIRLLKSLTLSFSHVYKLSLSLAMPYISEPVKPPRLFSVPTQGDFSKYSLIERCSLSGNAESLRMLVRA